MKKTKGTDEKAAGGDENQAELGEAGAGPAAEGESSDEEIAGVAQIEAVGEEFRLDAEFASGDLRDAVLEIIRNRPKPWSAMREAEQRDVIAAVSNACGNLVMKVANAIAAEGRQKVLATLDKITVKDGLKIDLKGPFDIESLDMLGKAQGQVVMVVMPRADQFDHQRAPARYDRDQPEMPLGGEEGDDDLANAADPLANNRQLYRDGEEIKVRHRESGDDLGPPTEDEIAAFQRAGSNGLADGERVNLKTGMVECGDADNAEDVREATPSELAAERERLADFAA